MRSCPQPLEGAPSHSPSSTLPSPPSVYFECFYFCKLVRGKNNTRSINQQYYATMQYNQPRCLNSLLDLRTRNDMQTGKQIERNRLDFIIPSSPTHGQVRTPHLPQTLWLNFCSGRAYALSLVIILYLVPLLHSWSPLIVSIPESNSRVTLGFLLPSFLCRFITFFFC